jgi:hypothetical protein
MEFVKKATANMNGALKMLAVAGTAMTLAAPATAQPRSYDVKHGFVATVPDCGGRAGFGFTGFEWAQSKRCTDIDADIGVQPFGLMLWGPEFGPQDVTWAVRPTSGSYAVGKTEAAVTSVVPVAGNQLQITGYTRAFGTSEAFVSGCSRRPRWLRVGSAFASSASTVAFAGLCRGQGSIRFWGQWTNTQLSAGFAGRFRLVRDPVSVKVSDAQGNVTTHPIIKVNSRVRGGTTSWNPEQDGGATVHWLRNTAPDMAFEATVNGANPADRGTLKIECRNGLVVSVTKTGLYFQSQPTPAVNSSSTFAVILPPIDVPYSVSVPPGGTAELVMDGGGHADAIPDSVVEDCQPLTELFEGYEGAHLSTPQGASTSLGIPTSQTLSVMLPIRKPTSASHWRIEAIDLHAFVPGADFDGAPPIASASVRLWTGRPGGGSPIIGGGDLFTNRLTEVTPTFIYRASNTDRLDGTRPIWKVQVDMSDTPFTTLNRIWIQIILEPAQGFPSVELLPNAWDTGNSIFVDALTGAEIGPVRDQTSGIALNPCLTVYATTEDLPCVVDYNDDGFVDFFDYLGFVDAFQAGTPDADFNADDFIDFFDYSEFVEAFEIGC